MGYSMPTSARYFRSGVMTGKRVCVAGEKGGELKVQHETLKGVKKAIFFFFFFFCFELCSSSRAQLVPRQQAMDLCLLYESSNLSSLV